jgi:hypothetical protein
MQPLGSGFVILLLFTRRSLTHSDDPVVQSELERISNMLLICKRKLSLGVSHTCTKRRCMSEVQCTTVLRYSGMSLI